MIAETKSIGSSVSPTSSSVTDLPLAPHPHFAVMAQTSAWLPEQQSQQAHENENLTNEQLAEPRTPLQSPNHEERDDLISSFQADPPKRQSQSRQTYEIESLLEMRYTRGAVPVMLRVKPEAIAENIFQYMGASSQRNPARSRGLSDISNASRRSDSFNSNNTTGNRGPLGSKVSNFPSRLQRQAPPPIRLAPLRRVDGFERFLRQHASPPHQRVTAGGRIVPAGPMSPPPMLDYGSLNGLLQGRQGATDALQDDNRSSTVTHNSKDPEMYSTPSMHSRGYQSSQGDWIPYQSGYPVGSMQPMATQENATYGYQSHVAPAMQTAAIMMQIGTFLDGGNLVFWNGMTYRSYWNGTHTVMELFPPYQQTHEQQTLTLANVQAPDGMSQYGHPSRSTQVSDTSAPLTDITNNGSQRLNRKTSDSLSSQPLHTEESSLKGQLTDLDKHLALFHFQITPAERDQMVANRRYLVQAIDKIRVSKEKVLRPIPIIEPTTGISITPVTKFDDSRKASASNSLASQARTGGKGLSPAAVPFVPRKARRGPGFPTKRNLEDVAIAAIARKDKAFDPSGSTELKSHREDSSSSVLDPSDPAMRVIHPADVAYASRYHSSRHSGQRYLCTEVAEFQEAIRQVREQARRYGCLGGQSKDPAYDAEQDIWWAICEREPIPLPPTVPDYESRPRPWNWSDSHFKLHRERPPVEEVPKPLSQKLRDALDMARAPSTQRQQPLMQQLREIEEKNSWSLTTAEIYLGKGGKSRDIREEDGGAQPMPPALDLTPRRSFQPYVEDPPETPRTHRPSQNVNEARIGKVNSPRAKTEISSKGDEFRLETQSLVNLSSPCHSSIYDPLHPNHYKFMALRRGKLPESQCGLQEDSQSFGEPASLECSSNMDHIADNLQCTKEVNVHTPPATKTYPSLDPEQDTSKVRSGDIRETEVTGAEGFLRKMLQSPAYTTAKPPTGISSGLTDRLTKFLRGGGDKQQQTANKENASSKQNLRPMDSGLSVLKSDPSTSITKMQDPLASSPHQNAHAASPSVVWNPESPPQCQQAQVSSPASTSFIRQQPHSPLSSPQDASFKDGVDAIAVRHKAMGFGLDGGVDPNPPKKNGDLEAAGKSTPLFNYKGVTHADFNTKRASPNNTWHKDAVEGFFQVLQAKERQEMQSYQISQSQKNSPSKQV